MKDRDDSDSKDRDRERREREADGALERLTRRVRNVRDLEAFEATHRGDGRFTFQLQKPPAELSPVEAREAADALEELAELVRKAGG